MFLLHRACPNKNFIFRSIRPLSTSPALLAGHSKWQNIKHRKARQDASRSSQNTKVSNMITVAVKEGGGTDPSLNVRLATLIENATKMSIPKKVIEAAISRGAGASNSSGANSQAITYEGVGPGGVAFIVETLTENKNRTAQQVRAAFLKFKGSLSPCSFLFQRRGWIELSTSGTPFDEVFEKCLEYDGVEDITEEDGNAMVYTEPADLSAVADQLKSVYKISDMGMAYIPDKDQAVSVTDPDVLTRLRKLENELDDLEDVNEVYSNCEDL